MRLDVDSDNEANEMDMSITAQIATRGKDPQVYLRSFCKVPKCAISMSGQIGFEERGHAYLLPCSREISFSHSHPSLSQRQQPRLGAHSFDIRTGHIILCHDEFFEVDVFAEAHT